MTDLTARPDPWASWREMVRAARLPAGARRRAATTGTARRAFRSAPISPERLLAEAVRLELTHPGSVPAARQFELIMADLAAAGDGVGGRPADGRAWTPFRSAADPCPYRPLAAGSWNGPGRPPVSPSSPAPWWARPATPAGPTEP